MTAEYVKHLLINTPLEGPALALQSLTTRFKRWRHPELTAVLTENAAIHRVMRRLLGPDSNCIDAGCHLGMVLSRMVRLAPRGRHVAFEPAPYKAAWLRGKFPAVEVHEAALGERPGTAQFHHYPDASGFDSLRPRDGDGDGRGVVFHVRVEVLDEVLGDRRIDFIKVDVEGAELNVFRGAVRLLERNRPPIVFECTRSGLDQFGNEPLEMFQFLTDLGYRIHAPHELLQDRPPLNEDEFAAGMIYPFRAFNFVAMPISKAQVTTDHATSAAAAGERNE